MRLTEEQICKIIDSDRDLQAELQSLARIRTCWTNNLSTRNLVHLLGLEETSRRLDSRNASLFFNGVVLVWLEDGQTYRQWPAVSGRPGFTGPEHQAAKKRGPLPAGRYRARQDRLERWDNVALVKKLFSIAYRGPFPGGTPAWGRHRVWLDPLPGNRMFGRSDFSIHGGQWAGSEGCIDLTSAMSDFVSEFLNYAKDLDLVVMY